MDDLQDIGNFNPRGEIESVNAQGGKEGHNGSIIHGNQGTTILSTWQMIERES